MAAEEQGEPGLDRTPSYARRALRLGADGESWLGRPACAWALYDVASSTFAAVVPTFFGLYFVSVAAGGRPDAQGTWGLVASASLAIAGVLAPFAGAWELGYTLATAIYDSLLGRVAAPTHVGRVSGFRWGIGLMGGVVALLAGIALMHGVPRDAQVARLPEAFLLAGLLFAAFAAPALLGLRCLVAPRPARRGPVAGVRDAYASVIGTLRNWRAHRGIFRFLIAYYLLNDVIVTIVFFIAIVMRSRFTGSEAAALVSLLAFLVTGAAVLGSLQIPPRRAADVVPESVPSSQGRSFPASGTRTRLPAR